MIMSLWASSSRHLAFWRRAIASTVVLGHKEDAETRKVHPAGALNLIDHS